MSFLFSPRSTLELCHVNTQHKATNTTISSFVLRTYKIVTTVILVMGDSIHLPPPHPPPLLSADQIEQLLLQGHLPITASPRLQQCLTDLSSASSAFFQNPAEIKLATYPSSHHTESGYYDVPNQKEYVTFRSIHDDKSSARDLDLDKAVEQMWQLTSTLLTRVLSDLSNAIGVPYSFWEPILDGCLSVPLGELDENLPSLLRVFKYLPDKGVSDVHTDNGLLTFCDGRDHGLQVWVKDYSFGGAPVGYWEDAKGPTILIGDTLRILSMNTIVAGRHRVVANENGRSSIVFALRASLRGGEVDLTPVGDVGNKVTMRALHEHMNKSKWNVNSRDKKKQQEKLEKGSG